MSEKDKEFIEWLESQILKSDAICRPQYRNAYEIVKYKFKQINGENQ